MQIPLKDFVEKRGQKLAAEALGVTQGALSRALRSGREIYVVPTEEGFSAKEICDFPRSRYAA